MVFRDQHTTELLLSKRIISFEEILETVEGWTADFRQLNREVFQSDVFQAMIGPILVTRGRFGCSVHQLGDQPSGMRCFAIQDEGSPEMMWFGHTVGPDCLLSFPTFGEVNVLSKPGFGVTVFSVPETLLEIYAEDNQWQSLQSVLGSGERILSVSPEQLKALRILCNTIEKSVNLGVESHSDLARKNHFQQQFLQTLMAVIFDDKPRSREDASWKNRKLNHLLEVINSHIEGDMQLSEMYELSGLPGRTAQHLFKQKLGITPKAYLKGQRLYISHRALWHADPFESTVSDIANRLGFWHMGQFAQDYRKIYGAKPSETLALERW